MFSLPAGNGQNAQPARRIARYAAQDVADGSAEKSGTPRAGSGGANATEVGEAGSCVSEADRVYSFGLAARRAGHRESGDPAGTAAFFARELLEFERASGQCSIDSERSGSFGKVPVDVARLTR